MTFINRLNASSWNYLLLRWINRPACALCGLIALGMGYWVFLEVSQLNPSQGLTGYLPTGPTSIVVCSYFVLSWAMACVASLVWVYRRIFHQRWSGVRTLEQGITDVGAATGIRLIGGLKPRLCSLVPGNQVLHLETRTLEVTVPNLPSTLDGFSW